MGVECHFKPQNVMLERLKDGSEVIKLIDLGTVIKYTPHPDAVYGTHGFYAREAVKSPSPQTDLYSICRTLAFMVSLMDVSNPLFGMPPAEHYRAFREYPALYHLLVKGTHSNPAKRFQDTEELMDQLNGVLRQVVGGTTPGVPVSSRMFAAGIMTTTGRLGPRAEAALDEHDKAIGLLRYGDQALRSGNYSGALTYYQQALTVHSKSVDAHLRIAEVLIEQEEYVQALAEITRAQRVAPGHWKVAWYTGRLLEAQGKLVEAAHQYRELLADLPGELPPQQSLARVLAKQGRDSEAVDLYERVLKAEPGNTETILGITTSLLNLQRWDDAINVLSGVSEAAAKYVDAQLLLCDLYLNRIVPQTPQNVQKAADAIHVLQGRTENSRYYLTRGDIYYAAWKLARTQKLPANITMADVKDTQPQTLGMVAHTSYAKYLEREQKPVDREAVVRRKQEVLPWRLL